MRWTGLDGRVHERDFDGLWATCAQHEIDHLDGKLFIERLGHGVAPAGEMQATAAETVVLTWAGMRGLATLALALAVPIALVGALLLSQR